MAGKELIDNDPSVLRVVQELNDPELAIIG
jgi:hypothetical protein